MRDSRLDGGRFGSGGPGGPGGPCGAGGPEYGEKLLSYLSLWLLTVTQTGAGVG